MKKYFIDFAVGDKTYELRLTTRSLVSLEEKLGFNPLYLFGDNGDTLPSIQNMIYVLHAALQSANHGISLDDTYDIFDKYLEEHSQLDFINVLMDVYKASGLINEPTEEEKN